MRALARGMQAMSRSILEYFSKEHGKENLLDPKGPLNSKIIPCTIAATNTES